MTNEFAVEISRDESATSSNEATYSVRFRAAGNGVPTEQLRRCRSDYALLRLIEDLLTEPESRLRLLERLRDDGRASIPRVALTEPQVTKYSLDDLPLSRATDPMCPVCLRSVSVVDRVVFRQGDAIHDECRVRARDMLDEVARFLEQTEGQAFCHTCLSSLFSAGFDQTRKIIGHLKVRRRFVVGPMSCSACRRLRVAVRAVPLEPGPR
jgi:hypothetical protein